MGNWRLELDISPPDKWLLSYTVPWGRERGRKRGREPLKANSSREAHTLKHTDGEERVPSLLSPSAQCLTLILLHIWNPFPLKGEYCCNLKCLLIHPPIYMCSYVFLLWYILFSAGFSCRNKQDSRQWTNSGPGSKMVPVKLLILGAQNTGKTGKLHTATHTQTGWSCKCKFCWLCKRSYNPAKGIKRWSLGLDLVHGCGGFLLNMETLHGSEVDPSSWALKWKRALLWPRLTVLMPNHCLSPIMSTFMVEIPSLCCAFCARIRVSFKCFAFLCNFISRVWCGWHIRILF